MHKSTTNSPVRQQWAWTLCLELSKTVSRQLTTVDRKPAQNVEKGVSDLKKELNSTDSLINFIHLSNGKFTLDLFQGLIYALYDISETGFMVDADDNDPPPRNLEFSDDFISLRKLMEPVHSTPPKYDDNIKVSPEMVVRLFEELVSNTWKEFLLYLFRKNFKGVQITSSLLLSNFKDPYYRVQPSENPHFEKDSSLNAIVSRHSIMAENLCDTLLLKSILHKVYNEFNNILNDGVMQARLSEIFHTNTTVRLSESIEPYIDKVRQDKEINLESEMKNFLCAPNDAFKAYVNSFMESFTLHEWHFILPSPISIFSPMTFSESNLNLSSDIPPDIAQHFKSKTDTYLQGILKAHSENEAIAMAEIALKSVIDIITFGNDVPIIVLEDTMFSIALSMDSSEWRVCNRRLRWPLRFKDEEHLRSYMTKMLSHVESDNEMTKRIIRAIGMYRKSIESNDDESSLWFLWSGMEYLSGGEGKDTTTFISTILCDLDDPLRREKKVRILWNEAFMCELMKIRNNFVGHHQLIDYNLYIFSYYRNRATEFLKWSILICLHCIESEQSLSSPTGILEYVKRANGI